MPVTAYMRDGEFFLGCQHEQMILSV